MIGSVYITKTDLKIFRNTQCETLDKDKNIYLIMDIKYICPPDNIVCTVKNTTYLLYNLGNF